ncbi:transporter substrate-binding domain-containing protein [Actinokineospora inagensis]|uniref:transporter substrate-binding domain-containing protein n=1 Tax=Actinokineospora inagensis TaxID=103730 RepID=UPI000409D3E6|nr:transporter substrate-binding domain-containing protein [Actinokineospora inagensis]
MNRRPRAALAAVSAVVLAGCSVGTPPEVPRPTAPVAVGRGDSATTGCPDQAQAPRDTPVIGEIRGRKLRIGVSQTVPKLSKRGLRGGEFAGLEIDLAEKIAEAVFPDVPPNLVVPQHVEFVAMPTRDRFLALATDQNEGQNKAQADRVAKVDLVIADASISHCRVTEYGALFSVPYLTTVQQVMTYADSPWDPARDGFTGHSVCSGSATVNLTRLANQDVVESADTPDCLVRLQRHQVDAISTDDVILEGLHDQDPNTRIFDVPGLGSDYTAVAMSNRHSDLLRVVNSVLERMRPVEMPALYKEWFAERPMVMPPATAGGG